MLVLMPRSGGLLACMLAWDEYGTATSAYENGTITGKADS